MPYTALLKVFISLQACYIETLKVEGSNFYKLPHLGKDKLLRKGALPTALHIDINLLHNTRQTIQDFYRTAPEHAKVFELPTIQDINAEPQLSSDDDSANEWIWDEEEIQLV